MARQVSGSSGAGLAIYVYPQNPSKCIRELNLPGCHLTITHGSDDDEDDEENNRGHRI